METFLITFDSSTGTNWSTTGNIIDGDSGTSGSTSATTADVTLYNSPEIDDTLLEHIGHPQSSIEYFAVRIDCQAVFATGDLSVQLISSTGSGAIQTRSITTTRTDRVFYFSRDTDDFRFLGYNLYEDEEFGVKLSVDSIPGGMRIFELDVTVHYLLDNNLHGDRSTFPYANDIIPLVENSPSNSEEDTEYVIKSDQVNTLGGAIVAVERTLLSDSDFLKNLPDGIITIRPPSSDNTILLFSAVVTGSRVNTLFGIYSWTTGATPYMDLSLVNVFSGQSNVVEYPTDLDEFPIDIDRVDFNFVSAIGWVTDAGTKYPLHVSPTRGWLVDYDTHVGYGFGFTTEPPPIFGSISREMSATQFANGTAYYDEDNPYFKDVPFEIRIFGIGVTT